MKVYPASKTRHWQLWQALREMGLDIQANWVDQPFNRNGAHPSPEEWADHWRTCVEQASNCDVLLFLDLPGENQCGARTFATLAEALPYCRAHQVPT
jgi:hypothetical protein